jgi:hypothetical protein
MLIQRHHGDTTLQWIIVSAIVVLVLGGVIYNISQRAVGISQVSSSYVSNIQISAKGITAGDSGAITPTVTPAH